MYYMYRKHVRFQKNQYFHLKICQRTLYDTKIFVKTFSKQNSSSFLLISDQVFESF